MAHTGESAENRTTCLFQHPTALVEKGEGDATHLDGQDKVEATQRNLWLLLSGFLSFWLCWPLLVCLFSNADFTHMASESLAYRYFFSQRTLDGEGGGIFLPQGQSICLLQQQLYRGLTHLPFWNDLDLRAKTNYFALATLVLITFFNVCLAFVTGWQRKFTALDRFAVFASLLVPLYGTGIIGWYYFTLPDYYALNMTFVGLMVFLVLWQYRNPSNHWSRVLCLGSIATTIILNKISLAPLAGMIVVTDLAMSFHSWRQVLLRSLLHVAVVVASGFLILMALYRFDLPDVLVMAENWYLFLKSQTGETNFWDHGFWISLYDYNFALLGGVNLAILFLAAVTCLFQRSKMSASLIVITLVAIFFDMSFIYAIVMRPANTTFFEVIIQSAGMAFLLIALLTTPSWQGLMQTGLLAYIALLLCLFPGKSCMERISNSREFGNQRWQAFAEILHDADGGKIYMILPDDSYASLGPFELLIKGLSRFPTWYIEGKGQKLLDEYAPGVIYYSEHSHVEAFKAMEVSAPAVVVWYDLPYSDKIEDRYPNFRRLRYQHWQEKTRRIDSVYCDQPGEIHWLKITEEPTHEILARD